MYSYIVLSFGNICKGLVYSGVWKCFNVFNIISVVVLLWTFLDFALMNIKCTFTLLVFLLVTDFVARKHLNKKLGPKSWVQTLMSHIYIIKKIHWGLKCTQLANMQSVNSVIIPGLAQAWKVLEYTRLSLKSLKIKFALKSTWKTFKGIEKSLNFTIYMRIQQCFWRPKSV